MKIDGMVHEFFEANGVSREELGVMEILAF